jgi:hypothetical protein
MSSLWIKIQGMAALIPFTSNYTDVSTYEGYQFEFHCQRCGNGYRSAFRHSVTGFGGRMAALGGGLLGGEIGARVQEVGLLAQWDRSSTRGATNDKRLLEASEDVAGHFVQCRGGCAEWVCRDVCWDGRAGCCARCVPAPAVDPARFGPGQPEYGPPPGYGRSGYGPRPQPGFGPQPTGGYGAPSGYGPPRVSLRHPGRPTGPVCCPGCGATTAGRFCAQCGRALAPPACPAAARRRRARRSARSAGRPAKAEPARSPRRVVILDTASRRSRHGVCRISTRRVPLLGTAISHPSARRVGPPSGRPRPKMAACVTDRTTP